MMAPEKLINLDWLRREAASGLSDRQIGMKIGLSGNTIMRRREANGIGSAFWERMARKAKKAAQGEYKTIPAPLTPDEKFARAMGGRRFDELVFKPQRGGPMYMPHSAPVGSLTGNAGFMCAQVRE